MIILGMAVKGQFRRRTRHSKSQKRKSQKRNSRMRNTCRGGKRAHCMRGGNYAKDITTRYTEGVATKDLNKFVVTIPGKSAMSGTSYKRMMEDRDRNGGDDI